MTILNLFIQFVDKILTLEILNFKLIDYMIAFAIIIIIFKIIGAVGGIKMNKKNKEQKKE